MLERPCNSVPFFDEWVGVLLGHQPRHAGTPQVAHHDQRFLGRSFNVEFRNLPRGAVVLGGVRRATRISHVQSQCPVLEAGEPPAVLVPPFVRCPDRAHALRREVREFLEQIVVHGSATHDPHHAAHARGHPGRSI